MTILKFHQDGTTPDDQWVFVFGSNLVGRHGAGAAKVARNKFGALYKVGAGKTGNAYAIPTKDANLCVLPLRTISEGVWCFLEHARFRSKTQFFVTRIGCGLAGYDDAQIAPMFKGCPTNCSMPSNWKSFL